MVAQPVLETKLLKCRRNPVASGAPVPGADAAKHAAGSAYRRHARKTKRVVVVKTRAAPASTQHPYIVLSAKRPGWGIV
jgi:hypothetical protein